MQLLYGGNENACLRHSETRKVLSYLLRETTDDYGNKVNYTYQQSGGQAYIQKIEYGQNIKVNFFYTQRKAKRISYLTGRNHKVIDSLLLSKIEVLVNNELLYYYKLEYEQPNERVYAVLKKVYKIYQTGAVELPLSFVWSDTNSDVGIFKVDVLCTAGSSNDYPEEDQLPQNDSDYMSDPTHNSMYVTGDIDGDGAEEVIRFGWKYVNIFRSDGFSGDSGIAYNSDFTRYPYGWRHDKNPRYIIDMNGDGCGDLVGQGHFGISIAYSKGFVPQDSIRSLNDQFKNGGRVINYFGVGGG
jgi:hypothetical protein